MRPSSKRRATTAGVARTLLILCMALMGCSKQVEPPSVMTADMKAGLQTLAQARILLGHQSVGRNILAGVQSLADQAGVSLRVLEIDGSPPDSAPGLFHSAIGKNGDPNSKCESFELLLNRPVEPPYDLVMMKFCYVDLNEDTPLTAEQLLDSYQAMVNRIRNLRSNVKIVHLTLPLRSDPKEWKTPIKRALGRGTYEDRGNVLRNAFNEGLRNRYRDEPIFDLAAVESTRADGRHSSFKQDGRTIYTLAPEYTDDGGHLNVQAQRLVAGEFVRVVGEVLK